MSDLRDEIAAAIAFADAVERECAEWQAQREQLVQRSADAGLIRKTNWNALQADDALVSEIDTISRDDVLQMIDDAVGIVGEETGKLFDELTAKISALAQEVSALRAIVENNNVTPMRGRDGAVAA
jgi:hypothetical protein